MSLHHTAAADSRPAGSMRSPDDIEAWLVTRVARAAAVDTKDIDPERTFSAYQLDSSVSVSIAGDLGEWLGMKLPITIFWEYPSIRALAAVLATGAPVGAGAAGGRAS